MKRRDFLKVLTVVPVVTAIPAIAESEAVFLGKPLPKLEVGVMYFNKVLTGKEREHALRYCDKVIDGIA